MSDVADFPKSRSWVWNDHRGELVKIRQDGRPASPSASSSTSRRFSCTVGHRSVNRTLLLSKRLVEAEYGRLDPEEWESLPSAHVTFRDCLKVALHLQATQTIFSKMFLDIVRLEKVQELLWQLVRYFGELFLQADLIRGIEPPAVGNQKSLQMRWERRLSAVLDPLASTYGLLVLGHGLENLHHMKRGRSLHSYGSRDNSIFERLYELCELLVWIVFRRRDRPVVHAEITRLFRGEVNLEQQQQQQLQQQQQQQHSQVSYHHHLDDPLEQRPKHRKKGPALSKIVQESSGLMVRKVPDMTLTQTITSSSEALPALTYDNEDDILSTQGLWLIGAKRADLNEYLEPAVQEIDQLSLLD
ncbi:protein phosphatase 1 regulatory subunit 36 [Penaeus vannamei]|uniref:protein phosphatase 1 regulatory subunit 36 n=1 Tax=Penaeus vannamei TaxID=6689 RepID=UPI00387FAA0C